MPGGPGTPLTVTFDQPLDPQTGRPTGPWFARKTFGEVLILDVTAVGSTVVCNTNAGGLNPGPDVVTYDGTDPLIRGLTDAPVAPFTVPLV